LIKQEDKRMVAIILNPSESGIFNNGLHQNGYFLYRLLGKIPNVQPFLIAPDDTLPEENRKIDNLLECFGAPVVPMGWFREKYRCDVMIQGSYAIAPEQLVSYKKTGTKIIAVVWGHKYAINQETMAFGRLVTTDKDPNINHAAASIIRRNEGTLDAVWLSPHFTWTKQYLAASYDMPLHKTFTAPYIWDPEIVTRVCKDLPSFNNGEKTPHFRAGDLENKQIYTLEPNINVLKTSLIPFHALELLYKENPDHFDHCYFYGGEILNENPHFHQLLNTSAFFSDGKTHKVTFNGRTKIPWVYEKAKVQLAHHYDCGLNYTYLEAAYHHHPIVHNSHFMRDMGYYYRGANTHDAAAQLRMALRHQDRDDLDEYNANCDDVVDRFSINNAQNIRGYSTLIENLFDDTQPVLPDYIQELEDDLSYGGEYFSPSHIVQDYLV